MINKKATHAKALCKCRPWYSDHAIVDQIKDIMRNEVGCRDAPNSARPRNAGVTDGPRLCAL